MNLNAKDAIAAMSELIQAGYTNDFRIRDGELVNVSTGAHVNAEMITVDAKYRFETEVNSGDASNVYALSLDGGATKGFLVDMHDLEQEDASQTLAGVLGTTESITTFETSESADVRYGVRKVRKPEFNADPERYVLRIGFPDFPDCPFGQGFTMLGYDTARQEYVWLVTKIIRDQRLRNVPYNGDIDDS